MTFRLRLVLAATSAVVIAVLAASTASYVAARNTLVTAADSSLLSAAETFTGHNTTTTNVELYQVVDATGLTVEGNGLPVTDQVRSVAAGRGPDRAFTTVDIPGVGEARELIQYLPPGTTANDGELILPAGGALQLATLLDVNSQLAKLGWTLGLVTVAGIVLAVLLGFLVARTALVPINELTSAVEDVAETTDVSRRLNPGGADELGRLRRAFNQLMGALESSREAQSQLVLDASHELRTPLTSLRTNMEVIRRVDELEPADRTVLVNDVLTQLEELTDLVGDLAELARGEQPTEEPELLQLDVIVNDAVSVASTHGRAESISFAVDSAECWIFARRDGLHRAVGNLLDNARKWSPPDGVVYVTCRAGVVSVRDYGPGIAAADLPHVFDRFYRARAARGLPGSGLGLAIVAQVASANGGTVEAGPAPGGGTLMTLTFPTVNPPVLS